MTQGKKIETFLRSREPSTVAEICVALGLERPTYEERARVYMELHRIRARVGLTKYATRYSIPVATQASPK